MSLKVSFTTLGASIFFSLLLCWRWNGPSFPRVNFTNILLTGFGRLKAVFCVLGSISSTFYEKLLSLQIPKAQKDIDVLTQFLHFWNLRLKKFWVNMLVKSTPGCVDICFAKIGPKYDRVGKIYNQTIQKYLGTVNARDLPPPI